MLAPTPQSNIASIARPVRVVSTMPTLSEVVEAQEAETLIVVPDQMGWRAATEDHIDRAIGLGLPLYEAADYIFQPAPMIGEDATVGEAVARGTKGMRPILVVDRQGMPTGWVSPTDLAELAELKSFKNFRQGPPRPYVGVVGGMATPFGVYLTNGRVTGGAKPYSIVLTGALLAALFASATYLIMVLNVFVGPQFANTQYETPMRYLLQLIIPVAFLGLMRVTPIAGIHAAEHKVVHAIERNMPLNKEAVSMMSRVHPRCGTNIAVGFLLFVLISEIPWPAPPSVRMIIGIAAAFLLWRRLGAHVQRIFTTKPPNDKQLKDGIKAGKQLLQRAAKLPYRPISFGEKILTSGLPQLLLGAFGFNFALQAIMVALGVPEAWRPF